LGRYHRGPGRSSGASAPGARALAYQAERRSEWGAAFNFDGPDSAPVRELVTANAAYWINELHLDGLRIDATQQIFDRSPDHVLSAIARAARAAGRGRRIFVVGENEPQDFRLLAPPLELDALWNDDFHRTARVAATGLIGPYVDAVLRVRGDAVGARRALDGLIAHLRENCIGYVSEVFDAEPPFTPGGCVAQAWGIAELLRCLLRTER
jgi:hypothetical protein